PERGAPPMRESPGRKELSLGAVAGAGGAGRAADKPRGFGQEGGTARADRRGLLQSVDEKLAAERLAFAARNCELAAQAADRRQHDHRDAGRATAGHDAVAAAPR